MSSSNNGGTGQTVTAVNNIKYKTPREHTTPLEQAECLVKATLQTQLRTAMESYGMTLPTSIDVGELCQFPGISHSDQHMGWCLLLPHHALFGDFSTGAVIEVTVQGVCYYCSGGDK